VTETAERSATARWPLLVLGVCAAFAAAVSRADAVADFYAGKQVSLYIGYSPGGGYDTYARVLARHIGKHIPGNPTVIPQNMPGAGSLTLANYLYNIAPKDGTALGTFGRGLAMDKLLGGAGIRFDATKFTWIGSLNNEVSICASWHTSSIKSVDDLKTHQFIVGGTGSGSDTAIFPLVLRNLLGLNIKLISGYPGGNDVLLAMERGEVDGRCGWSWGTVVATRPDWIEEHQINVLLQIALDKHPDLPDVPLVMDLARNDDERQAMELIFARQVMGRPYLAPPAIPVERRDALRRAFDATASDSEFLADAAQAGLELNPVTGVEIDAVVSRIYSASPSAVKLATDAIRETN
jgi:tripartite-type tricarboxylate transporter receptor subunit TctC